MNDIVAERITVSTVLISGHAGPQTMEWIADQGGGRLHVVQSPSDLPQIFIKEAMVILKSAISEEPFQPRLTLPKDEPVRGISPEEYPPLQGYVCTTPKARAELPLLTGKGDPLLAHWQYGLGRSAAFTSDARAKWARDWMPWPKYRQFWSQIAQWSLRRLENADFTSEVSLDRGEGRLTVEAIDKGGNYRNFLSLQATVVSPKGNRQSVHLEQTGPGHYEARFPTHETGAYAVSLMDLTGGTLQGLQRLGASVNYSPEFTTPEPNLALLRRLAEAGAGKVLAMPGSPFPGENANPFLHDRRKTFQPVDLFESLLKLAILLFPLDVGVRRIQVGREEWLQAARAVRRRLSLRPGKPRPAESDESLAALLARREAVRSRQTGPVVEARPELFQAGPPAETLPEAGPAPPGPRPPPRPSAPVEGGGGSPEQTGGTTGRLLAAKKRAQRKMK